MIKFETRIKITLLVTIVFSMLGCQNIGKNDANLVWNEESSEHWIGKPYAAFSEQYRLSRERNPYSGVEAYIHLVPGGTVHVYVENRKIVKISKLVE